LQFILPETPLAYESPAKAIHQDRNGAQGEANMHFIVWLVISGIAGFLASKLVNKSGSGLIMDIVLGIIGGFVAGFIASKIPALAAMGAQPGIMGFVVDIIFAMAGAALVIVIWNMLFRRNATS